MSKSQIISRHCIWCYFRSLRRVSSYFSDFWTTYPNMYSIEARLARWWVNTRFHRLEIARILEQKRLPLPLYLVVLMAQEFKKVTVKMKLHISIFYGLSSSMKLKTSLTLPPWMRDKQNLKIDHIIMVSSGYVTGKGTLRIMGSWFGLSRSETSIFTEPLQCVKVTSIFQSATL